MKKNLPFCCFFMLFPLFAQEVQNILPVLKAQALEEVIQADTAVSVKLTVDLQKSYDFSQRSFYAYFPSLPEGFPELAEQLKYTKTVDPKSFKWSSVKFDAQWLPNADRQKTEHLVTIPVTGWPAGDYRLHVNGYFQPLDKASGLKPVYRSASFLFTIEG